MYMIETETLLGICSALADIRTELTPDADNGNVTAKKAREYVCDVIDDLKEWEGVEIEPVKITFACKTLDKALETLRGNYFEEIEDMIVDVNFDLGQEEKAAIDNS